jgi:hypothetical protein
MLTKLLLSVGSIKFFSNYIEVASQHNTFSRSNDVTYTSIKSVQKSKSKLISTFISVRRAVDPNEDKSRKF